MSRTRSRSRGRGNDDDASIEKRGRRPRQAAPPSTTTSSSTPARRRSRPRRLWSSTNPSKRWAETFFLAYSPFWMTWALCVVVPFEIYERCDEWGYLAMGVAMAAPCVALPLLFPGRADAALPLRKRFWFKATVWIAVFSHIGNYFWTHYFYELLGAEYTFRAHRLNGVPFALYLMTHAYFVFYHSLANVCIRRALRAFGGDGGGGGQRRDDKRDAGTRKGGGGGGESRLSRPHLSRPSLHWHQRLRRPLVIACVVFPLSYFTAFMETATIAHFPHYRFRDRTKMYTVGSLFYAIYFFVSFPWFYAMDEDDDGAEEDDEAEGDDGREGDDGGEGHERDPAEEGEAGLVGRRRKEERRRWSTSRAATDALAAGMLVTILLDAWRLLFGGIVPAKDLPPRGTRLPWML